MVYYSEAGYSDKFFFVNDKGLKIQMYKWAVDTPKAIILGMHGITSHARFDYLNHPDGCYKDSWIERFNQEGYTFYGVDHQSHGGSEGWQGSRCNVQSFTDLIDDGIKAVKVVCTQNPGIPVYIMGLSMGGNVVTQIAERISSLLAGCISIAAMLALDTVISKPSNRILLPLAGLISKLFPHLGVAKIESTARVPEIFNAAQADGECYFGMMRARMSVECLKATKSVIKNAPLLTCPLLVIHAENDTLCEPAGSQRLYDSVINCADKELHLLKEGWHVLTLEKEVKWQVFDLIINWINKRVSSCTIPCDVEPIETTEHQTSNMHQPCSKNSPTIKDGGAEMRTLEGDGKERTPDTSFPDNDESLPHSY